MEKACGILGSCSPGEQGDHQDGSPGSWFPVLPLSLHGLGFTQHTLWSTGWGLDQPGMLGPGPAWDAGARPPGRRGRQKDIWRPGSPDGAGCTRRAHRAHTCHRDLGASPCSPELLLGKSEVCECEGERRGGREPVRGEGSCILGCCCCSVAPLAPVHPLLPGPVWTHHSQGAQLPMQKERGCLSARLEQQVRRATTQAPPAGQGPAHPSPPYPPGLRMPLLFWRTESPHPRLPQRPTDRDC